MKKENRLLKNNDFKTVLDNKKSVANKEYIIYIKENDLNKPRIGISVSSKIGNSVVRHKVKRQISEMIKEIIKLDENLDIVIITRKNYLESDYQENKKSLSKLLNKARKGLNNEKN
jgi:ribonuclease P protein component